jgi:TPP-dependent pyruvate/acetoin dehydrogenase alpha subunit
MEAEMAAKAKSTANLSSTAKSKAGPLLRGEKLQELYATMLRCRALEARARSLSKQGHFAFPTAKTRGQEAAEVGCTIDLRSEDSVASAERDLIFKFIQGLPLGPAVAQLAARGANGEETDPAAALSRKIARPSSHACGPFGLAVQRAMANRFDKKSGVVVAFSHRDSGSLRSPLRSSRRSSIHPWDEALAVAGMHSLPILFVVRHILPEGSARSRKRAQDQDLSSQSQRHGFPGIPVDGNDVVAVYRVAYESLERARRGGGPTLIACETYPGGDRADDGRGRRGRLREPGIDPIRYMEEYLLRKGLFSEAWKKQVIREFARELDEHFAASEVTAEVTASIDPSCDFR